MQVDGALEAQAAAAARTKEDGLWWGFGGHQRLGHELLPQEAMGAGRPVRTGPQSLTSAFQIADNIVFQRCLVPPVLLQRRESP